MKKMTFIQKIKYLFQCMKIGIIPISIYLFLTLIILFFGDSIELFNANYLLFIIIFVIIFIIHFLANVIESLGIILKKVYLINGTIIKSYKDYKHGDFYGGTSTAQLYNKKYISLFSNKVKTRRAPVPIDFNVRIKVESNDSKHTSPWFSIKKRIFEKKDKYNFMIILYNNIPVSIYREKKK